MRKFAIVAMTALAACSLHAASPATAATDSTQRAVATFIASNFKLAISQALSELTSQGLTIDSATVVHMVCADLAEPYDRDAHNSAYDRVMLAVASARAAENKAFLEKAAARPGAQVLPSGLVFETMTAGNGPKPAANDRVLIRYRGVLPDGTVFDEITPDDDPMETRPSQLVPGMTEGICMMQAGGNYILTIPAKLAYGATGAGGVIPPDTPLRFDVELVDILP